jgi:8-oxo-dGTP diphosphatase
MGNKNRDDIIMKQQNPKVGAGVVIIKNGKTLLAKRKGKHGSGMWGSMGGHVEFGESPIEAVQREAREELGIEIGNIEFAMCMNMIREGKHYLDISFTAEIINGEPTIQEPDRIESIGWYSLDELPNPLFPPVQAVLEAMKTGKFYYEVTE